MADASLTYAGFWRRLLAAILDSLILGLIGFGIGLATVTMGSPSGDNKDTDEFLRLLGMIFSIIYTFSFWRTRQATPGKLAVSARIVDASTGGHPRPAQFVLRYLGYFLSLAVFGLGFFWAAWDRRKQGWHDKLAGTVVIHRRIDAKPVRFRTELARPV